MSFIFYCLNEVPCSQWLWSCYSFQYKLKSEDLFLIIRDLCLSHNLRSRSAGTQCRKSHKCTSAISIFASPLRLSNVTSGAQMTSFLYPPPTSWGGVYWNHPVCPSVCPSVRVCPEFFSAIFQWIFLKLCILVCHHGGLCTCNFGHDHLKDK